MIKRNRRMIKRKRTKRKMKRTKRKGKGKKTNSLISWLDQECKRILPPLPGQDQYSL